MSAMYEDEPRFILTFDEYNKVYWINDNQNGGGYETCTSNLKQAKEALRLHAFYTAQQDAEAFKA